MSAIADVLARLIYGRTAAEAHEDSECIRCRSFVHPFLLEERDLAEYRITALCPLCWDDLWPESAA